MLSFRINQLKRQFDDVSFISLIFVGFLILVISSINEETNKINEIIVRDELAIKTEALSHFNGKNQSTQNIIDFAKEIKDVKSVCVFDKDGKMLFSNDTMINQNMHLSALSANVLTSKFDNKNKREILAVNVGDNGEKIVVNKELSKNDVMSIWKKHFSTLFIVIFLISFIYTIYNVFFIKKINFSR